MLKQYYPELLHLLEEVEAVLDSREEDGTVYLTMTAKVNEEAVA